LGRHPDSGRRSYREKYAVDRVNGLPQESRLPAAEALRADRAREKMSALPSTPNSNPVTYEVAGKQYLAVSVGGGRYAAGGEGRLR
jgi:hypothetical protein